MKIAISGITGFIGSALKDFFVHKEHEVIGINRSMLNDYEKLQMIIDQVDVVINLAGATINKRWTEEYKEELWRSRVEVTKKIVTAINKSATPPQLFISTSAIGYYNHKHCYDETEKDVGNDYLAQLCQAWESEAQKCKNEVRCCITRLAIVLSHKGGALPKLIGPMKRLKMKIILGDGDNYMSWISRPDLIAIYNTLINDKEAEGIFNCVAPQALTQKRFLQEAAEYMPTWITIKIPHYFLRLVLGEAADALFSSLCVSSVRLNELAFEFKYPYLEDLLKDNKA